MTTAPSGGAPTSPEGTRPDRAPASVRLRPLAVLVRVEPGRPAVAVGLRMAIVVTVPLAVGAATGRLVEATTVCLGALNAGMADVGGARASRWHALLAAAVLNALAFAAGTLAGHSLTAALPLLFVVALAAGMANLFGNVAANVGFVALILTMVGLGTPGDGSLALERLWLAGLGGLWAIVLVLVVWPVHPYGDAARAVGECCTSLGRLVRAMAGGGRPGRPGDRAGADDSPARVRSDLAAARSILVATRSGRRGDSTEGRRLQELLRAVRRLTDQAEGFAAARSLVRPGTESAGLREVADRVLSDIATVLDHLGGAVRHLDTVAEPPLLSGSDRLIGELYRQLDEARRRADLTSMEEIHTAVAALEQMVDSVRRLSRTVAAPSGPSVGDPDGLLPVEHAGRADGAPPSPAGPRRRAAAAVGQVVATLRANLSLDSVVARHALRLATTATVGLAIGLGAHLVKGYWITLTIAVVMRPFAAATVERAVLRVAGTVLGAGLTVVVASAITQRGWLIAVMFVLAVLAFSLTPLNYGLGVVFLTPLIIVLISLADPGGWGLAGHRIADTLIGGALALIGGYVLWPTSNRVALVDDLAASLEAERALLHAVLSAVAEPPGQRPYEEIGALSQQGALAVDNVTAGFQQLLGEAPSRRGPVDVLWALSETSRELLVAGLAAAHQLHVMDRAHRVPEVDAVRTAVDRALAEIVPALGTGAVPTTTADAVVVASGSLHQVVDRARGERRDELLRGDAAPTPVAWLAQDLTVVDEASSSVARSIADLVREVAELEPGHTG